MGKNNESAAEQDLSDRFANFIRQFQKDNSKSARRNMATVERLADLEADLGFLAMLNVAMLRVLSDKGLLEDGELLSQLEMADKLDGVEDGTLSMASFRSLIGMSRSVPAVPKAAPLKAPAAPAPAAKAAAPAKKAAKGKAKGKK